MYSSIINYLKETLPGELPGEKAHLKMLPPGRRLKTPDDDILSVKQSSVLVLLFPHEGQLCTCLTRRSNTMKHHPGQISFPGGMAEEGERSPEITALREANEEVGINPEKVEILGYLSSLFVEVSGFRIYPCLAWADEKPEFTTNSDEVEEIILFPIGNFAANEIINVTEVQTVTGILKVNYYPFEGNLIWGATAMIISELVEILKAYHSVTVK
ncbi:MAG TPA: CoA pyrophosphatase [Prolixibacteraceae bacterium]|nr:CoA pyrophosphatase [Prolixibacteraceae bacterium]HPR84700.1 CoA pyrophosphatase [Prolixibacteraceae bacterium]